MCHHEPFASGRFWVAAPGKLFEGSRNFLKSEILRFAQNEKNWLIEFLLGYHL
jgi:hypothetical protein